MMTGTGFMAVGVNVIAHTPFPPDAARVQVPPLANVPAVVALHVIVPVGVIGSAPMSTTVAVHDQPVPTAVQLTVVVVGFFTLTAASSELPAASASARKSATMVADPVVVKSTPAVQVSVAPPSEVPHVGVNSAVGEPGTLA
jgi:hypothetical protein